MSDLLVVPSVFVVSAPVTVCLMPGKETFLVRVTGRNSIDKRLHSKNKRNKPWPKPKRPWPAWLVYESSANTSVHADLKWLVAVSDF
jgi:hypothetical protein